MKTISIFCTDCEYRCRAKVRFKKTDLSGYMDAVISNMNCLNSQASCNWTRIVPVQDDSTVADRNF